MQPVRPALYNRGMSRYRKPHVLGVDDGAFHPGQSRPVPVIGVLMAGNDQVEAVVRTEFPRDGDQATEFLAGWIPQLHLYPSLQALLLGGITIAGLGIIDLAVLSRELARPVIAVTRKQPGAKKLEVALDAAGLAGRKQIARRGIRYQPGWEGVYLACAGIERDAAIQLLRPCCQKSRLPEPLRLAHLIGRALLDGESRGRA